MAMRTKKGKLQVFVGDALVMLGRHLTKALCDRVFQKRRHSERERVWSLHPLLWFWVMTAAKGIPAIKEAVEHARKGWGGLMEAIPASRQSLCKRAKDLDWRFFKDVFHMVVDNISREAAPRYAQDIPGKTRDKWPKVLIVDASKLDPIARRLKLLKEVKDRVLPGVIFAVYELYKGISRRLDFDPDAARSEYKMAVEWLQGEDATELKDALVVGDRLYGTPKFLSELARKGCFGVVRRNKAVKIRQKKLLSRKTAPEFRVTIEDWEVQVGEGKEAQTLRLIVHKGPKVNMEWLTNVLDPERLTEWEVSEFYIRRWQVERMFADLKCVLDMKSFLCAHPNGVAHQVYGTALVYAALRMMQGEIGKELEIRPEYLSPKKVYQKVREAICSHLSSQITLDQVKRMNRGVKLRIPVPKQLEFYWIDAKDLLVEKRKDGRGHKRKGKPNWKSFRHITGGEALLN